MSFSFTEPYVLGRPISAGFQLFATNSRYVGNGVRVTESDAEVAVDELFGQQTVGGSFSVSTPLAFLFKRSAAARFARLGLQYTYSTTSISDPDVNSDADPANDILVTYRQSGIRQSTVTPTFFYNSLDASIDPTRGQSLALGLALSGGPLGGDLNAVQPSLEYKFFRPVRLLSHDLEHPDVFGMRLRAGHIRAFGAAPSTNSLSFIGGTPIYSRYFLGGEETVRGYDAYSVSPVTRIVQFVSTRNVVATDLRGRDLVIAEHAQASRRTVATGVINRFTLEEAAATSDGYTVIGGDTQLLANFEYRRPVFGPITLAAFLDVGSVFNTYALGDVTSQTECAPTTLSYVTLNPRGGLATDAQLVAATTPELASGALPPGFRTVYIGGEQQQTTRYYLSEDTSSVLANARASLGLELRAQVPVINVPFRMIFAYNPNARTSPAVGQIYEEKRFTIRFSIGRTF